LPLALAGSGRLGYGLIMANNPLTQHLEEAGESYGEHFVVASSFGLKMIAGGLACMVHAVFPFLCQRTGSDAVRRLNATLCKRADKPNWERHPII
jgi:hypothetical protein